MVSYIFIFYLSPIEVASGPDASTELAVAQYSTSTNFFFISTFSVEIFSACVFLPVFASTVSIPVLYLVVVRSNQKQKSRYKFLYILGEWLFFCG